MSISHVHQEYNENLIFLSEGSKYIYRKTTEETPKS